MSKEKSYYVCYKYNDDDSRWWMSRTGASNEEEAWMNVHDRLRREGTLVRHGGASLVYARCVTPTQAELDRILKRSRRGRTTKVVEEGGEFDGECDEEHAAGE